MTAEEITEHQFRNERGNILIREPILGSPWWLATWLPHERADEGYPGWTMSSETASFPTDRGPLGIAEWIDAQPWGREEVPEPRPPAEATPMDVPAEEWDQTQRR